MTRRKVADVRQNAQEQLDELDLSLGSGVGAEAEPENGELVETEVIEPKQGSLAWLQTQEHVDVRGALLPHCHRIKEGMTWGEPEPGRCKVINASGERCRARPTRVYGVCFGHLGGGGMSDPHAMSAKANSVKAELRVRRELLGIGARRVADPRSLARLAAQRRAEDIASAVWAPLDDGELSSVERQVATIRGLDATFPLQALSLSVSLPADAAGVEGMSWADMQVMAGELMSH